MGVAKLEDNTHYPRGVVFDDLQLYRDTIREVEKGSARARAKQWFGGAIAVLCITSTTYSVMSYITIEKMVAAIADEKAEMADNIAKDMSKRCDQKIIELANNPARLSIEAEFARERLLQGVTK